VEDGSRPCVMKRGSADVEALLLLRACMHTFPGPVMRTDVGCVCSSRRVALNNLREVSGEASSSGGIRAVVWQREGCWFDPRAPPIAKRQHVPEQDAT